MALLNKPKLNTNTGTADAQVAASTNKLIESMSSTQLTDDKSGFGDLTSTQHTSAQNPLLYGLSVGG